MQRPRAVVTHPYRHAVVVEHLPDVVRVDRRRRTNATGEPRFSSDFGPMIRTPSMPDSPSSAAATNSFSCASTAAIPMSCRYRAAAANPTTCDVIGVPASNRCGAGA